MGNFPNSGAPQLGTRVREARIEQGMRQAELAAAVGISPSYLNLIEHNRRRIAPELLDSLAAALNVSAVAMSAPLDQALVERVLAFANLVETGPSPEMGPSPEKEKVNDLASRFPGWAGLIAAQADRMTRLEARIQELSDRMAHDPALSASLHEVIAAATSIRSTASILNGDDSLDVDWQQRFHKNLHADAIRLADSSDALMSYLDAPEDGETATSPTQEAEDILFDMGYHFPDLEGPKADVDAVLKSIDVAMDVKELLRSYLTQYAADAKALPLSAFEDLARAVSYDPAALAAQTAAPLSTVLRRLAALSPMEGHPPMALIQTDASGTLHVSKHLPGVIFPRGGACPLWPIYASLGQPGRPIRQHVTLPGTPESRVLCVAVCEQTNPALHQTPRLRAMMWMLADPKPEPGFVEPIGPSCRICPRPSCDARREPSVMVTRIGP